MIKTMFEKRFQVVLLVVFLVVVIAGIPMLASAEEAQQAPASEEIAPVGNPDIGKMLYTGGKRFENGGPPCISCHNVGVGALGGGALGPNLMLPNEKYGVGPAPVNPLIAAAWINSPGTPVMGPVFSRRNVTDEEVEHLKAFFNTLPAEQTSKTGAFVGIGAAGFVGIMIFFGIVWSGRYRNRVGGTAHEAIWRNYGGKGGK